MSDIERVLARVDMSGGPLACWPWQGSLSNGYGQVTIKGRNRRVHRLMYEEFVGPVPEGNELDHLCRHRACCNPAHLEAVPHLVNVRRGWQGHRWGKRCPNGHARNGNTFVWGRKRQCYVCMKEATRRYRARKLESSGAEGANTHVPGSEYV